MEYESPVNEEVGVFTYIVVQHKGGLVRVILFCLFIARKAGKRDLCLLDKGAASRSLFLNICCPPHSVGLQD